MHPKSLGLRLTVASSVWIVATLAAAGFLLVLLFRDHIERRFDARLQDHLQELVAASEFAAGTGLTLRWVPYDPRFNRPYSGWYWQILRDGRTVRRSDSAWDVRLEVADPGTGTGPQIQAVRGPEEERLRALVENITLPDAPGAFTYVVAGPIADIERDVTAFAAKLALTLAALGLGLVGAVLMQVRFGLKPLRRMRQALADIRSGKSRRLPDAFPQEVAPVVDEFNALLDHSDELVERARTQAGNLAHALNNPLTVIRNEAHRLDGDQGAIFQEQAAVMGEWINRYLSRARAAGSQKVLGARTPVSAVLDDLRFSMELLHRDRDLTIETSDAGDICFRGDAQDLEEMVGNLMDNACKWARRRVAVRVERAGPRLRIGVEDDGPGIPDGARRDVLRRGGRFDEMVPGSGLGLDIVRDVAELYGGSVRLEESALGGVRAELDLPAAE